MMMNHYIINGVRGYIQKMPYNRQQRQITEITLPVIKFVRPNRPT
jgi:hypothetical protein